MVALLKQNRYAVKICGLGLRIDDIEKNMAYANSGRSVCSITISLSGQALKKCKTQEEIIEAMCL